MTPTLESSVANVSYDPPRHTCEQLSKNQVVIRFVNYGTFSTWQMEIGRRIEFGVHFCPFCGVAL